MDFGAVVARVKSVTHPAGCQCICCADHLCVEHAGAPELTGHKGSQGEADEEAGDDETSCIGAQADAVHCRGCQADTEANAKAWAVGVCSQAEQAAECDATVSEVVRIK